MNKSVWVVIEVLLKIYLNDKLKSSAILHPIGTTKPRAETWRTKRYGESGSGVVKNKKTTVSKGGLAGKQGGEVHALPLGVPFCSSHFRSRFCIT